MVRQISPALCRIIVSTVLDNREEGQKSGADLFLLKPFFRRDLVDYLSGVAGTVPEGDRDLDDR